MTKVMTGSGCLPLPCCLPWSGAALPSCGFYWLARQGCQQFGQRGKTPTTKLRNPKTDASITRANSAWHPSPAHSWSLEFGAFLPAHLLLEPGMLTRLTLLVLLLGLRPLAGQEIKPEEIYKRLLPSIVTLHVETRAGDKYVGTAFLGLANDAAVTSWHVVADARKVTARFADNEFVDVPGV